jgi:hypothetical protein
MRGQPAIWLFLLLATATRGIARGAELLPAGRPSLLNEPPKTLGLLSCASAACHGGQELRAPRAEFAKWLASDPHARSARTLGSPEFCRILARASSGQDDGPPDPAMFARCAACHDPQGLATADGDRVTLMNSFVDSRTRGVGCESCHGAAEHWLARHYQRGIMPAELTALGMNPMKDLTVRGKTCAACHVGDAQHDMNHDMIAAGHPPLRFELSAYHDLIRQKHWPDAERVRTPEFKVRLWAAGQAALLEATHELSAARSERAAAGDKLTPWPELAEYDCFACHQRLRTIDPLRIAGSKPAPGESLAIGQMQAPGPGLVPAVLSTRIPGMPARQPWNLALAEQWIAETGDHSTVSSVKVLDFVERQASTKPQTWSQSCQELLALKAVYLAWRDAHPGTKPAWANDYERRLAAVGQALQFGSKEFEWPAFDWHGLPPPAPQVAFHDQAAISQEIAALANRLAAEYKTASASGD